MADAERIGRACDIVVRAKGEYGQVVVVCSALSGATDVLLAMSRSAAEGDASYASSLRELSSRHETVARDLLGTDVTIENELRDRFLELGDILRGIFLVRECSPRTLDLVASFGERLSCSLVAAELNRRGEPAEFVDAREIVRTDAHFGSARVDFLATNALVVERLSRIEGIPVVTGFIGSTATGETTTLGRGGSDYTASILGAALGAEEVEIWTDVSGVMTADPRKVKAAYALDRMSYEEAMELSHFGAKVIHPPTMIPAMRAGIPIRIKNTFAPDDAGTLIAAESSGDAPIKGISSIDRVALFRVEGPGMVGVTGVAGRVFGALAAADASAILITQASSEHSICFAVRPEEEERARLSLERELSRELADGAVHPIVAERNRAVVAVVGERMRQTPGIAASVFGSLAGAGVNVVAVAQGSSERNVSIVVDSADVARSLTTLHAAFFEPRRVSVFLIGTGSVGSTLLRQMAGHDRFVVRGIMNSRRMLVDVNGLDPSTALSKFPSPSPPEGGSAQLSAEKGEGQSEVIGQGEVFATDVSIPADLAAFLASVESLRVGPTVVVDCTASETVPAKYAGLLRRGIEVVTANKKGLSGPQALFDEIRAAERHALCRHETTVGAGLPTIRTIHDLFRTGDRVEKIEGVFSGTMSYLFNAFRDGMSFSSLVTDAQAKGYTEPDPRDDLSGTDVARKLVILAREIGWKLEVADVDVEAILPEQGFDDAELSRRVVAASAEGKALRYLARLEDGRASVSLVAVGPDHPCFALSGADNVFSVTTARYATRPLVVRGPGAGAEVTAAGVLADLYQI